MKALIIFGFILVLTALIIFAVVGFKHNWNFESMFSANMEEKTTNITEDFSSVEIFSDTANITFVPTTDGSRKVVAVNPKNTNVSVTVENGVLKINSVDSKKWYQHIFNFGKPTLTLYIPEGEYTSLVINEDTGDITIPNNFKFGNIDINLSTGDTKLYASANEAIKIKSSTGDITVENITCGSLKTAVSTGKVSLTNVNSEGDVDVTASTGDAHLTNINSNGDISATTSTGDVRFTNVNSASNISVTVSTGKAFLNNVSCVNFTTNGNTGDLNMTSLIASGTIDIERSTGDVHFDRCDGAEIYVLTDTGSVKGTFLTNKIFQVKTDTGKIEVPECWEGGKCKITTDTGDVKISIA